MYNKYTTEFKFMTKLEMIPKHVLDMFPRSTIDNFKKYDFTSLIGFEYTDERLEMVKQVIESKQLFRMVKACLTIKNTLMQVYTSVQVSIKQVARSNRTIRKKITDTIERTKDLLGFDRVLSLFQITRSTFYNWLHEKPCQESPLNKCFQQHPLQLTTKEVTAIKKLFADPVTTLWPACSIYYYGLRNNLIAMSLNTFYKYAKLLGLSKPLPPHRRKKHCQGIRASRPNKLLHADMTVFTTADNVKAYIYIIMDNYSRKILGWKASLSAKADIAFECLKGVYETHIAHLPEKETVKLMTDGGSEVNNEMDVTGTNNSPLIPPSGYYIFPMKNAKGH